MAQCHSTSQVFGVGNHVPLTYVVRSGVDDVFQSALDREKHIAVYGSSKQGKTCLRRKTVKEADQLVVSCTSALSREAIYSTILRKAGVQVADLISRERGNAVSTEASVSGEAGHVFLRSKGELSGTAETRWGTSETHRSVPLDFNNCNDVIDELKANGFNRWIVLDDFHYLSRQVQLDIANDLKAFFDESQIRFLIIGVWREPGKLYRLNNDLEDRSVHVDADRWNRAELERVLAVGSELLNVRFSRAVCDKILSAAMHNVGLLQAAAEMVCDRLKITKTQSTTLQVYDQNERCERVSNSCDVPTEVWLFELHHRRFPQYRELLTTIARNSESDSWIWQFLAAALITLPVDELAMGARLDLLLAESRRAQKYSNLSGVFGDISRESFAAVLGRLNATVAAIEGRAPVLEYDDIDERLFVLDGGFFIFRRHQTEHRLLDLIGLRLRTY